MADYSWAPGERRRLTALSVLVVGAMLYPVRQNLRPTQEQVDSFPLSYYPMFRTLRKRSAKIVYAVGVDAQGERYSLSHQMVGDGGFNQARHQLNRVVKAQRTQQYATALAARVAGDPAHGHLVRVEILRGTFDLDACLLNGRVHADRDTLLASAAVATSAASLVASGSDAS